ncbi:diguanylate cyclase [Rhizobium laguerreae]|nr:diguanylate cyclase [Rhizobium laguerreae]
MDEAFKGRICENSTEADIRTAEGTVRTIKLIAGALPWDGNPVVQLLLQDITDLKTIQNALHRLTITDELTGAFNRRHAFAIANRFFDSTRPGSHAFAVAVLDIDHFKRVNDTYGHAAGDAALRTLSQTVRELISTLQFDGSTFARVGGEEFLLLLPEMESDAVIAACEHVRCAIEQQPIVTASGSSTRQCRSELRYAVRQTVPSTQCFRTLIVPFTEQRKAAEIACASMKKLCSRRKD